MKHLQILFILIPFFIYHSSIAQQNNSINCYKKVKKETKMLQKYTCNKAIKKIGNIFEQYNYSLQLKELQSILTNKTITEHFKHTSDITNIKIREVSFKICNGSFITVYYKQKNNKWYPLECLVSL
ncbi:MAG: hypothetical protein ACSHW4_09550 [Cellulophaga sp.]